MRTLGVVTKSTPSRISLDALTHLRALSSSSWTIGSSNGFSAINPHPRDEPEVLIAGVYSGTAEITQNDTLPVWGIRSRVVSGLQDEGERCGQSSPGSPTFSPLRSHCGKGILPKKFAMPLGFRFLHTR